MIIKAPSAAPYKGYDLVVIFTIALEPMSLHNNIF